MRRLLVALLLLPVLAPVAGASDCRPTGNVEPPRPPSSVQPQCRLVQPGMAIYVDRNRTPFTMSVLLRGSDGRSYFVLTGTAIRTGDAPPFRRSFERRYRPGQEPVVRDDWGRPVGRVLYAYTGAIPGDGKGVPSQDFAFARVDAGVKVTREIRGIGMPTGLATGEDAVPRGVVTYGQGPNWADDYRREGMLPYGLDDPALVYSTLHGTSYDTGAPVVTDGNLVVGYHNGATFDAPNYVDPEMRARAGVPVYRLAPVLAQAKRTIGVQLALDLRR